METTDRDNPRPAERSFLSLLPWRNFRRALFLILALLAVVAIKKSGGGLFRNLLDSVAPSGARSDPPTVHLRVRPGQAQ